MKKKFVFTVYDPEVLEVMVKLKRKKWLFIEAAVKRFLETKEGVDYLNNLLSQEEEIWEELHEGKKGKGKAKGKGRINFDDFF